MTHYFYRIFAQVWIVLRLKAVFLTPEMQTPPPFCKTDKHYFFNEIELFNNEQNKTSMVYIGNYIYDSPDLLGVHIVSTLWVTTEHGHDSFSVTATCMYYTLIMIIIIIV